MAMGYKFDDVNDSIKFRLGLKCNPGYLGGLLV
jgi:hypothetical protein